MPRQLISLIRGRLRRSLQMAIQSHGEYTGCVLLIETNSRVSDGSPASNVCTLSPPQPKRCCAESGRLRVLWPVSATIALATAGSDGRRGYLADAAQGLSAVDNHSLDRGTLGHGQQGVAIEIGKLGAAVLEPNVREQRSSQPVDHAAFHLLPDHVGV